jgi:hypothetical protein
MGPLMLSGAGASLATAVLVLAEQSVEFPFFVFFLKTRNMKMTTKAAKTALTAINAGSIIALCADGRRPGGGASHAVGRGGAAILDTV